MDRKIFTVLIISLITRVIYLFLDKNLWWDAAVYLAMGKYIVSFGQLGFWEPIRPLLWPFLLSYAYIININPVLWGNIWSTIFSLGCIYLTYCIAKKLFNKHTALLASILLSFSWTFFFFSARLYTEIPAVFFALCAYYFFLKEKHFETGIFTGLAFLTKFPEGIILIVFLFFSIKSIKKLFWILLGCTLITLPYFAFNYFAYGSPINILIFAQEFLKYAGIWIFEKPWYWYPLAIIKENFLFLFVIPGILFALYKKKYSLLALAMIPLLYFSHMPHKELRFAILFLPFLAILAAYGYQKIFKETSSFIMIVLLLFIVSAYVEVPDTNPYFTYFQGKDIQGEVLVAHPLSGYYVQGNVSLLYYPWFNSSRAEYWLIYIQENSPEYISLDTCEGGFLCPPNDTSCPEKQQALREYINSTYSLEWQRINPYCEYSIYKKNLKMFQ